MAAPTVSQFYADSHLGNRFGTKAGVWPYGPKGHLGVDFNGWPVDTPIPAWCGGVVKKIETTTGLGLSVIVKTDIGGYAGYHHLRSARLGLEVGDQVRVGDIIGGIGYSGTLVVPKGPDGTHLHTTWADSALIGGQDVHDPLPTIQYIRAVAGQGGSVTPIGEFLMALSDKQQRQIYDNIAGNNRPFADFIADAILDRVVARAGSATGNTSLRAALAWADSNTNDTREIIRAIKPGTATVDTAAIAAEIVKQLGAAQAKAVADELAARLKA